MNTACTYLCRRLKDCSINLCFIIFGIYLTWFTDRTDILTFPQLIETTSKPRNIHFLKRVATPFLNFTKGIADNGGGMLVSILEKVLGKTFEHYNGFKTCNIQVHFFLKDTKLKVYSFPPNFDETKHQLYFTVKMDKASKYIPVGIIANICEFFAPGYFCFFCNRYFGSHSFYHRCRYRQHCFACSRPVLNADTYVTEITRKWFCSQMSTPFPCGICNVSIMNESCLNAHQKGRCRFGYKCVECNMYISKTRFCKTLHEIKQAHQCNVRLCFLCGRDRDNSEANHLCTIKKPSLNKEFVNLGFLQCEVTGYSPISCRECTELQIEQPENEPAQTCSACKDTCGKDLEPNLAVLLLESGERGKFDEHVFGDFLGEGSHTIGKYFHQYLPFALRDLPVAPNRRLTKFNQRKKIEIPSNFFLGSRMKTIDKCLNYILQEGLTNYTILVHGGQVCELVYVADSCLKKGLRPKIFRTNQKVLSVDIEQICIRFIDSKIYLDQSLPILAARLNTNYVYFPQKLNKPSMYGFCGEPPSARDYWVFYDGKLEDEKKEAFAKTVGRPWKMTENLIRACKSKAEVNMLASLDFLKNAFSCQDKLRECLGSDLPTDRPGYVHPFDHPLFTKAGFAYQMFLVYSKSVSDIYVVGRPIPMKSSRGEIEFALFLEYAYPDISFQHAWSPHGQKRFLPQAIPDIYSAQTKVAYFYNGCSPHGHTSPNCPYMRRTSRTMYKADKYEVSDKFNEKLTRLLSQRQAEVRVGHILWQCEWEDLKKNNEEVKKFMTQVFNHPPKKRLDPRDARKSEVCTVNLIFSLKTFFSEQKRVA